MLSTPVVLMLLHMHANVWNFVRLKCESVHVSINSLYMNTLKGM